jgi:hypothetical protein
VTAEELGVLVTLLAASLLLVVLVGGGRWLLIGLLGFVSVVLAVMAEAANGTPPEQR